MTQTDDATSRRAPAGTRPLSSPSRRRRRRRVLVLGSQLLVAVTMVAAWQLLVMARALDPFFFSQPSSVAARMGSWVTSAYIWRQLGVTLLESGLSMLIGGTAGLAAGFILGRFALFADVAGPFIATFNALPRIVLAPMFIIWFGLGIWSKVALGVSLVFFIVFYSTFSGVRSVDKALLNNVRMLGANGFQQFRHVIAPNALSWIISSMHTSVGFAIAGAVVAEYLGASQGIGYVIANAEGIFDITTVMAGVLTLSVFVVVITIVVQQVERYLLRWQ